MAGVRLCVAVVSPCEKTEVGAGLSPTRERLNPQDRRFLPAGRTAASHVSVRSSGSRCAWQGPDCPARMVCLSKVPQCRRGEEILIRGAGGVEEFAGVLLSVAVAEDSIAGHQQLGASSHNIRNGIQRYTAIHFNTKIETALFANSH